MILDSQSRRLTTHLTGVQPDRSCRIVKITKISSKLLFLGNSLSVKCSLFAWQKFTPKNKRLSTNPNSHLFIGITARKRRRQEKERQVEMTTMLINLSSLISVAESVFSKRKIEKYQTSKQRTQMAKRNHSTGQQFLRDKIPQDSNLLSKQALYRAAKAISFRLQDFIAMNSPIHLKY